MKHLEIVMPLSTSQKYSTITMQTQTTGFQTPDILQKIKISYTKVKITISNHCMAFCAKMLNNSLHFLKKGALPNITYSAGAKGKATRHGVQA